MADGCPLPFRIYQHGLLGNMDLKGAIALISAILIQNRRSLACCKEILTMFVTPGSFEAGKNHTLSRFRLWNQIPQIGRILALTQSPRTANPELKAAKALKVFGALG